MNHSDLSDYLRGEFHKTRLPGDIALSLSAQHVKQIIDLLEAQSAPTPAAQHNATSACEVCWHNAWVPTEEGLRCDYCWLNERYTAKSAGVDEGMRDRAADICAAIPKLSPDTKGTLLRLITAEERDCMRAPMKILRADYQRQMRDARAELQAIP